MIMDFRLLIFVFLFFAKPAFPEKNNITTLPGYEGELPFPLESGYIAVGNNSEVQLYYLYAASNNPTENPVLLWTLGGPGCSSLASLFFENGPITIDYDNYAWDGSLPPLTLQQSTWTEYFNIIFLDAPAGTGYSYATTQQGWLCSDWLFGDLVNEFLRKWFSEEHPELLNNPLYIGGDGYSGIQIPIAIQAILDGNVAGSQPFLNIQGYVLGNPGADYQIDWNARYAFANRLALVSNELYEEADAICGGNFTNPPNDECLELVNEMTDLYSNINLIQVINPNCKNLDTYLKLKSEDINAAHRFLKEEYKNFRDTLPGLPPHWCQRYQHDALALWANDETVQRALYVAEGMSFTWTSCNDSIILDGGAYDPRAQSVVAYHQNFTKTNLRALILSGDHDLENSWIAHEKWVKLLELPLVQRWTAVTVNNQTAGYVRKYTNGNFNLTLTTVKGGSHYTSEERHEECYQMVKRWLAYDDLLIESA